MFFEINRSNFNNNKTFLNYDNKLNEAIELCEKEIQELKGLKIDEQKEKDEVNKIF